MQGLCRWCGVSTQLNKAYMWSDFFWRWYVVLFWKEMYMRRILKSSNASVGKLEYWSKKPESILKQKCVLPLFGVVHALKGTAFLSQSCYQHPDCRAGFSGAPRGPPLQAMAVTCSCSSVACTPTVVFCGNQEQRWWWWVNPGVHLGYGTQLCLGKSWGRYLEAWESYPPGSVV